MSLRTVARVFGLPTFIAMVATPLLVGALAMVLLPMISAPSHEATASVNVSDVTGQRASYEVATQASDFAVAYDAQVDRVAADYLGERVDSQREGESAFVSVSFTANDADQAEQGLRRAAEGALSEIAAQRLRIANQQLSGAETAFASASERAASGITEAANDAEAEIAAAALDPLVRSSAETLTRAESEVATATVAAGQVREVVEDLEVTVEEVSDLARRIRLAAIAALTAALLIAPIAFLLYRRQTAEAPTAASESTTAAGRYQRRLGR